MSSDEEPEIESESDEEIPIRRQNSVRLALNYVGILKDSVTTEDDDIPDISPQPHNRRWCTFFQPVYLFPQKTQ